MYELTDNADFRPTADWEHLRFRAAMLRRLREFFDSRGFLEIETPILSADTVVDRHLDPFYTEMSGQWSVGSGQNEAASGGCPIPNPQSPVPRLWLQTSPEFAMKRLLAAGAGRIYQVARVFRLDELGPLHNPEFTLVEWYQPGEGLDEGMQLTSDLCEAMLSIRHTPCADCSKNEVNHRTVGTRRVPDTLAAERISYAELFDRVVGIDPHNADGRQLAAIAKKLGVESPASLSLEDRDGWLDLLMIERIQPHLGQARPTLLYDYPASQAALARIRHDEGKPPVAERFELYIAGVEIANGYHELLDPAELRARNARVNAQRRADGKPPLPEESRLLAAMESGLPPSVGVALGFDRLLMAALGAKTIAEVMAFPFDRA
ncbi:MAG: EF-P lysine aminoacylase EpmA [Thermoguttaceae bacterium]|jgi:lysyl-tRNA synthetase class 2